MGGKDTTEAACALLSGIPVSRETWERLETFVGLLRKWQPAQNLVSPATLEEVWTRHVADSLQLLPLIGPGSTILDMGSGAGFPGMVLAIAASAMPEQHRFDVHLCESNKRKAAFLRTVSRECHARARVHDDRVEAVFAVLAADRRMPDMITARALAPLERLFQLAEKAFPKAVCLFHKGRGVELELSDAKRYWEFDAEVIPSRVAEDSVVLRITQVSRRRDSSP